jgi:hypothetical protein
MANNSCSNIDIEVYEPTRCFRCQAPVYIKPEDYGIPKGEYVKLIAYDFYSNKRHYCVQALQQATQPQPKEVNHEEISEVYARK